MLGRVSEWLDMQWAPRTPCDMVNEAMRLWGHLYVWDEDELIRALWRRRASLRPPHAVGNE